MIKKKLEFKVINTMRENLAQLMTSLTSPVVKSRFSITAVMAKEVKVTKELLHEMIVSDFKVEVGTVPIKGPITSLAYNTLKLSEKVNEFCVNTARRYDISEPSVWKVLDAAAEDLTYIPDGR